MAFLSRGMQIGIAEGFMDQQAESRERQERLTEDRRKEIKAAQIRARKILDEQDRDDQINLNITKNVLGSSKLSPELVKQLDGLDTETKIELGQSLRSTLRVMGEKPLTYDRLAIQVKKQIGQVLANDERIRQAKQEKASQAGTTEEQTESIFSAISPTARGRADRARLERGVSPEVREVMDRDFAQRRRKGLEDLRFEAEDLIGSGERAKIENNLRETISTDKDEDFPTQKMTIIGAILFDDKNPPTRGAANRILQDFKEIEEAGIEFNSENSKKIAVDIRERGSEVVFNELKKGTHELSPKKTKDDKKETEPSKKDDTDDNKVKGLTLNELLQKEELTRRGDPKPTEDGFIQTVVSKDKTQVFDVYVNKEFKIDKVSK